jgi:hypothetical protein
MLSRPPLKKIKVVRMIMQLDPFTHEIMSEDYKGDEDFRGVYKQLKKRLAIVMEGIDYHLQDVLFYKLEKLCILREKRVQLIREAHTYKIVGNFGVTKRVANLQQYVYWSNM